VIWCVRYHFTFLLVLPYFLVLNLAQAIGNQLMKQLKFMEGKYTQKKKMAMTNLSSSMFRFSFFLMAALSLLSQSMAKKAPLTNTISDSSTPFLSKNKKNSTRTHHQHQYCTIGTNIVGGFTTVNHRHQHQRQHRQYKQSSRGLHRNNSDSSTARPGDTSGLEHKSPYSLHKHHYVVPMAIRSTRKNALDIDLNLNDDLNHPRRRFIGIHQHRNSNRNNNKKHYAKLTPLSSTISAEYKSTYTQTQTQTWRLRAGAGTVMPLLKEYMSSLRKRTLSSVAKIDVQDCAVYLTYACTMVAISKSKK